MSRNQIVVAMLVLTLAGCGPARSKGQPDLAPVSGKVTLDGQPLSTAIVHFLPAGGRESMGITDKEGNYTLGYLPNVLGASLGKHKVVIMTYYNDEASPEALNAVEKIPTKYNSETTLSAEVKKGNNKFDFDLKTD